MLHVDGAFGYISHDECVHAEKDILNPSEAIDNPKCENIGCQVVSYQAATGRWKKLQFHSYNLGSAATSFSDGGG